LVPELRRSCFLPDQRQSCRLYFRLAPEPSEPMHLRFPAEPCELALGVIAVRLLRRPEGELEVDFAAQVLRSLLVAKRVERPCIGIAGQQGARFLDQSGIEHAATALVDARVERVAFGIEPD